MNKFKKKYNEEIVRKKTITTTIVHNNKYATGV